MTGTDKITCRICGAQIHSVAIHIKQEHPETTLEEYTSQFPDEPLLSDLAQRKIEEHKAKTALNSAPATASPAGRMEFHKIFRLGAIKSARKKDGSPIMVTVCEGGDLVPEYNAGYVYDMEVLKSSMMAIEFNENLFLYGHSGVGKTCLIKNICAATQRNFVRVQHTVETQYSHIVGQWTVETKVDDNGNAVSFTRWQNGPLVEAMINGYVYCADEFDRASPNVNSTYQSVLEGEPLYIPDAPSELRLVRPHPQFRFCATGNTNGAGDDTGLYQSTHQQDAASFERFGCTIRVTYLKPKEEVALLCAATRVSKSDAENLVDYANSIRDRFPEDFDLTIGPRVLIKMAKMGILRGSMVRGVELAYANRLPEDQRKSAIDVAERRFD